MKSLPYPQQSDQPQSWFQWLTDHWTRGGASPKPIKRFAKRRASAFYNI